MVGSSFIFDLKGTLDIMVQRTGDGGQGKVLFVQNNFYYDAFFLKAIGASHILLCKPVCLSLTVLCST